MQNKAKVKIGKIDISLATIKDYDKNREQSTMNVIQNKAKQSQSKPIGEDQYKTKDPRHKTKDTSLESEVWGLKSGRKASWLRNCREIRFSVYYVLSEPGLNDVKNANLRRWEPGFAHPLDASKRAVERKKYYCGQSESI